jgi:hypothetical protein
MTGMTNTNNDAARDAGQIYRYGNDGHRQIVEHGPAGGPFEVILAIGNGDVESAVVADLASKISAVGVAAAQADEIAAAMKRGAARMKNPPLSARQIKRRQRGEWLGLSGRELFNYIH